MSRVVSLLAVLLMVGVSAAADAPYRDTTKSLPEALARLVEKKCPNYKIQSEIYRVNYDDGDSYSVEIYEFRFDDGTGKMLKGELFVGGVLKTYPLTRVSPDKLPDAIKVELENVFSENEKGKVVGDLWRWRQADDKRWVYDFTFKSKLGRGTGYLRKPEPDEDFASMAFYVK